MATKTLEDYQILYKILEDTYKELTPQQKTWVDDNWKSMMERFAEELIQSADDAIKESEEEQEEHNLDEILARPVGAKKDSSAE